MLNSHTGRVTSVEFCNPNKKLYQVLKDNIRNVLVKIEHKLARFCVPCLIARTKLSIEMNIFKKTNSLHITEFIS